MKASEIKVGGLYRAKVSDNLTVVKVLSITKGMNGYRAGKTVESTTYQVLNTKTGKKTVFKSAAKFRAEVQVPSKDLPPQPGDDEPVDPSKPDGIKMGQLFGRKPLPQGTSTANRNAEAHGGDDQVDNGTYKCTKCSFTTESPKAMANHERTLAGHNMEFMEGAWVAGEGKQGSDPQSVPVRSAGSSGIGASLFSLGEDDNSSDPTPSSPVKPSGGQHGPSPVSEGDFPQPGVRNEDAWSRRLNRPEPAPVAQESTEFAPSATNVPGGMQAVAAANPPQSSSNLGAKNANTVSASPAGSLASLLSEPEHEVSSAPTPSLLPEHLIVIACAGTGKTTTLVGGLQVLKGLTPLDARGNPITPSPQQKAVWDAIALSKDVRFVCFAAFNKMIERELRKRVPRGVDTSTMHGMGFKAICKSFKLLDESVAENNGRTLNIIEELLGVNLFELRRTKPVLLKATTDLAGLCKANLVGFSPNSTFSWEDELDKLVTQHDIDLDGANKEEVYNLVPRVLERSLDVARDKYIDYIDMIWLPVVLNLPMFTYDMLFVDEFQDTNRCQQALALKAIGTRGRLILCGDPKQAIYAFAGADSESMPRMEKLLTTTPRGVKTLHLTVTRRCGKAIVKEAQQIVPEFEAHESNPAGSVKRMLYPIQREYDARGNYKEYELPYEKTYMPAVADNDMVLCRANAPLVNQCFKFLKQERKANIQGRDVGKGLIALAKKCWGLSPDGQGVDVVSFSVNLSNWLTDETRKENGNKNPSESRLTSLNDRAQCLQVFAGKLTCADTGDQGLAKLVRSIEEVFTSGKRCPKCRKEPEKDIPFCPFCKCDLEPVQGIRLSSIHKAKGLEADRVFYIRLAGKAPRSKMEAEQESNLEYVAITRAINELVYVS